MRKKVIVWPNTIAGDGCEPSNEVTSKIASAAHPPDELVNPRRGIAAPQISNM